MTLVDAAVLGLIQGITEFLPISSSGHLVLTRELLGISQPDLSFDIALHLASLGAVTAFFWRRLLSSMHVRQLAYIVLATAPVALIGISIREVFEAATQHTWVVGIGLFITTLALWFADVKLRRHPTPPTSIKSTDHTQNQPFLLSTWKQALVIGFAQAVSLLPGVSRSGTTVAVGLLLGLSREAAFRFSFLLLFPAVLGAVGLEILSMITSGDMLLMGSSAAFEAYALGMLLSFVAGLGSLRLFEYVLKSANLRWFAVYTAVLSITSFVL
jgi:undecaprenyl-diphosphatase